MNVDYKNTFKYFSSIHPNIINGTVLDYGSNYGTFLASAGGKFKQENYTGIDVDFDAIQSGKEQFPNAEFIHYNSFNHMYNPTGLENLNLPITKKYDTVISYSVFTHTSEEDFLDRLEQLFALVVPGGSILFTFCDPDDTTTVNFFTQKRIKTFGKCDSIRTSTKLYLIDADIKSIPDVDKMLITFYNKEYLKSILRKYNVSIHSAPPRCLNCFQSCVMLQKTTYQHSS
jgi:SAM-dependent methyltransferase